MGTKLPSSGQLSVSQINVLKSLGTVQTSLDARESQYMGGNPANANTSQVCMPNQAEMSNSPRPGGTTAVSWSYTGSLVAWRPARISEFYGAYNGLPTMTPVKIGTNDPAGVSGQIRIDCSGSDAGGPYSVYKSGVWYVASNSVTFNVTTGTYTFYVRDSQNCGTNLEFSTAASYP